MSAPSHILVTGGAGFIGSHLVEKLLAEGKRVRVLDNLSSGRIQNFDSFKNHPLFSWVQVDLTDFPAIAPHFKNADTVFHLAALADIVPSIQNPSQYFRANVDGTLNVMEAARQAKTPQVVYAASSSCYGIPDSYPTPETAPIRPMYPYALTKSLGEQIALHWGRVYQIKVNSLRFFNVYGPRARTSGSYGAVFGVFLAQKLRDKPLTIVGDGTQTRDFIYVTDIVRALIQTSESNADGNIFNVGTGKPVSINRIADLLGCQDRLHIPKRPGEPDSTHADISKIKTTIGWEPQIPIEAGIQKMLESSSYWADAPLWTPESIASETKAWFTHLGDASR